MSMTSYLAWRHIGRCLTKSSLAWLIGYPHECFLTSAGERMRMLLAVAFFLTPGQSGL